MSNLKNRANDLAGKGRFGDDALLHVSKQELAGLASLAPGGKLTVNPDTGLPEAFFFLPFLAGLGSLFGAAAPAAMATAPAAAAAGAGALGAGLSAGMTAATTAIPAATTAALPAAVEMATAAAAPATAAASTLPSALSGAGGLGTLAGGSGVDALASTLPAAGMEAAPLTAGVSTLNAPAMAPQGIAGVSGAGATEFAPGLMGVQPTAATTLPQAGDLAAGIGPAPVNDLAGQSFFPPSNVPAGIESVPVPAENVTSPMSDALSGGEGTDMTIGSTAGTDTLGTGAAVVGDNATNAIGEGIFDGLGSMDPTTMLMLASMIPSGGGGGGGDDDEDEEDIDTDAPYEGPSQRTPPKSYRPGIDPEFRYFSRGGIASLKERNSGGTDMGGGIVDVWSGMTPAQIANTKFMQRGNPGKYTDLPGSDPRAPGYGRLPPTSGKYWGGTNVGHEISGFGPTIAAGAPLPPPTTPAGPVTPPKPPVDTFKPETQLVMPPAGYQHGIQPQWDFYRPVPKAPAAKAGGGLVKKYATGGLASLGVQPVAPVGGTPPSASASIPPVEDSGPEPIPESPFPKSQIGSKAATQRGDQELIAQTVAAIKGQVPNGQAIILAFINTFGEDALNDLVQRVRSTEEAPVSDGMSDSVPAMINGQEPAAISEGEFIVPADVVSGLGNGSTDAGAQQLHGMMDRVRQMRHGGSVQPPAIDARRAMPV